MTEQLKPVYFRCNTCEYYNRQELGMPNFVKRIIEFESLTEAWQHLQDREYVHNIEAFIKEEK